MKIKTSRLIGLIFIVLILAMALYLVSYFKKPFSGENFSKGQYILYCYSIPHYISSGKEKSNRFKFNSFFIDNADALEKIKNEVVQDMDIERTSSNDLYALTLLKEGKNVDGGILDIENNVILYYNGKYKFNTQAFLKLEKYFNLLEAYKVNCVTYENTNKFVAFVKKSNGFMYDALGDGEYPTYGYNGVIKLFADTTVLSSNSYYGMKILAYIQKQIDRDYKGIADVKVSSYSYYGNDTVNISLLCKEDISDKLPDGYKIAQPYTNKIDVPIYVYNLSKKQLIDFFDKSGITGYKIVDLNEKNMIE